MKKILCSCLALSIFATSALAFDVTGSWHTTNTKATYSVNTTHSEKGPLWAKSWIENVYGDTIVIGTEYDNNQTPATSVFANALIDLWTSPQSVVGRGRGCRWVTPDHIYDPGYAAETRLIYTNKTLPAKKTASLLTEEQQSLYDNIAETIELRNESIAQSFGIDFSGFTKIRVTQSEALAPEYMDMAFVASALIDMHAGDSVLIGHVNPDRDLMYVTKQDAELINHLYTFTCDEEGIWHLDGEITTASSGVSNADVAQAKLAYNLAVFNAESD